MAVITSIWSKARRAVIRRGVPVDEADDLVQEAFLKLQRYELLHDVRSMEAFVMQAATNLTIDRRRRVAVRDAHASPFENFADLAEDAVDPEEALASKDRLKHLEQGIAQLPERVRRVLLMRRIDGMSFRDIAAAEGQSVSAVEKQVARATLSLMKWMDGW